MRKQWSFLVCSFLALSAWGQTVEQKMDELLSAYARQNKFNGAALVAQKGKVIYQKGFGFKDAEQKLPNDANAIFQVGSLTKQITAAVVMQLQQEKKLSVSDKLSKFYPEIPNSEKITIENLLTHTSGIHNYTEDSAIMNGDLTKSFSKEQMVSRFAAYKSDFEPGQDWHYSNSAYSLLGYIIEKVENKPYEKVVRERIFSPLGMTQSGFDFTHLKSAAKTKGYFSLQPKPVAAPILDSTLAYAAGAIYSTVGDFYKWERAVASGKLLRPESWRQVFTPYKNKYGYGWGIDTLFGQQLMSHSGGIPGYTSFIMRFPQDDLAVIVFDNTMSVNLGKISKSLAAIALGQPYELPQEKKAIEVDAAILKKYVGEYQLAPNFILTVSLEGNQLKAQATGQPEVELFAEKENLFFIKIVDAKVEFVKDENGNVTELILHQNGQHKGKKIK